jgi:MacB-like periplasmic core domain
MTIRRIIPLVAVVLCLSIAACQWIDPRPSTPAPSAPADSYRVASFEFDSGSGATQTIRGASFTPAFFQAANVPPILGRRFMPEEPLGSQVVTISYRFWQRSFKGDPACLGTTIRLIGRAYAIVGVMPREFDLPPGTDLWLSAVN